MTTTLPRESSPSMRASSVLTILLWIWSCLLLRTCATVPRTYNPSLWCPPFKDSVQYNVFRVCSLMQSSAVPGGRARGVKMGVGDCCKQTSERCTGAGESNQLYRNMAGCWHWAPLPKGAHHGNWDFMGLAGEGACGCGWGRTGARPSISSKKMMAGCWRWASSNSRRSWRSASPTHLDRMSAPLRMKKATLRPALLALAASARATSVFPVPAAMRIHTHTPHLKDTLVRGKSLVVGLTIRQDEKTKSDFIISAQLGHISAVR